MTLNSFRIEKAVETINKHHNLGDAVYGVRESDAVLSDKNFTGNTWEHPIVKAYSDAVTILRNELPEAFK